MCRWVMVNGEVCKTQEELSLEMACCIYITGEPHGQPADDSCLCCVDVPRMAAEVGMSCQRPRTLDDDNDFFWFVLSEPEWELADDGEEQEMELDDDD